MEFNKIQKDVDDWVSQYKIKYFPPLAIMTQLIEECGELAREVNNRFGPRTKKSPEDTADIESELADIIFAVVCMANSQNIDLKKAWEKKMDKQYGRDKDRFEKNI
ncbi:nucleotide pyrophosphohydrolase [Nanoarchaeota archaeon]